MSPDNTATTWRDLADQLTPEQVASMEQAEIDFGIPDKDKQAALLLDFAREHCEFNIVDAAYADVSLPAGAQSDSSGWERNSDGSGYSRSLVWRDFEGIGTAAIAIDGRQRADGSFTRQVSVYAENTPLTAAEARQLAAGLLEAADQLGALDTTT